MSEIQRHQDVKEFTILTLQIPQLTEDDMLFTTNKTNALIPSLSRPKTSRE